MSATILINRIIFDLMKLKKKMKEEQKQFVVPAVIWIVINGLIKPSESKSLNESQIKRNKKQFANIIQLIVYVLIVVSLPTYNTRRIHDRLHIKHQVCIEHKREEKKNKFAFLFAFNSYLEENLCGAVSFFCLFSSLFPSLLFITSMYAFNCG